MNKRPIGPGGTGLPAKPYTPTMPGPAPPLPTGPPPPQPPAHAQYQDPQAAAHAAAWAAYYQSQGHQVQGATFTPPTTQPQQATTPNPYANYGYSAGAQQQHSQHAQGYQAPAPGPGPSTYRPPVPAPGPQQYPQQHGMHGQPSYQPPVAQSSGYQGYQAHPQYPQQQPQQPVGYNYQQQQQQPQQAFQPSQPPVQPYRPPPQAQQPQQPYYPQQPQSQQQQHTPYRPAATPPPNRPYQPRIPSGPARPPMNTQFPPAKRPRFDNNSPMNNGGNSMQARPHRPPPPIGPNMGQPGFNHSSTRPPHPISLPPSVPSAPANAHSAPSAPRNSAPVIRPPIHLGLNGPPPSLPFGGSIRGIPPNRGMVRGGRGGMVNAPKGPRRVDVQRQNNREINERKRKEKEREREKEREAKTTMTDFRIVGIEVKELGWSWGIRGNEVEAETEDSKESVPEDAVKEKSQEKTGKDESEAEPVVGAEPTTVVEEKVNGGGEGLEETKEQVLETSKAHDSENVEPAVAEEDNAAVEESNEIKEEAAIEDTVTEPTAESSEVKSENVEAEVEEKRGEKRKAKTPDGDEGSSTKKRSGEYLLTHGKPNEPNSTTSQTSSHESNQNRFRIYFESPPELDRVPKALRRNPNKRWRRESSSVAPTPVKRGARDSTFATVDEETEVQPEVKVEAEVRAESESVEKVEDGGEAKGQEAEVQPESEGVKGEDHSSSQAEAGENVIASEAVESIPEPTIDPIEGVTVSETPGEEVSAELINQVTEAPADTPTESAEGLGDISMITDPGTVAAAISELVDNAETSNETESSVPEQQQEAQATSTEEAKTEKASAEPASSADIAAALAVSAENSASAYKTRTRRRSSVSSVDSEEPLDLGDIGTPSTNRVSILYEDSTRRLCVDASSVERVKIYRTEGKIEVVLKDTEREENQLPKGILVEMYDSADQRFVSASVETLEQVWAEDASADGQTVPPLHRTPSPLTITVYLNKKRPLSEPKWCRTNSADEWLIEQFGAKKAAIEGGWKGKLEIVDPDPAPTLQTILDTWASSSSTGSPADRRKFTTSLLSSPNDLLEILLRLTRGDRNPTAPNGLGPLATAIRPDSPYASHQTHVSLAILAMYRLTTDYAAKAGESSDVVNEKISDIIKSLPVGMITRSLDGLFKEWGANK